jgi:hypothetical protein
MLTGIDGDNTAGGADIENASHLADVDRIAISAGMLAQDMLEAATHEIAGRSDANPNSHYRRRLSGGRIPSRCRFHKSWEMLEAYRAAVERLAAALAEYGELHHDAIERILADGAPRIGPMSPDGVRLISSVHF